MLERDSGAPSGPEVEFLFVADRAEVVGGKLYVMGGAWDQTAVHDFDLPIQVSLAVSIQVPWHATNQHHQLAITVEDADARPLASLPTAFVVGRPPQLEAGSAQRVVLAIPFISLKLPGPGTYVVFASVNGEELRRTTFRAVQAVRPPGFPPGAHGRA